MSNYSSIEEPAETSVGKSNRQGALVMGFADPGAGVAHAAWPSTADDRASRRHECDGGNLRLQPRLCGTARSSATRAEQPASRTIPVATGTVRRCYGASGEGLAPLALCNRPTECQGLARPATVLSWATGPR